MNVFDWANEHWFVAGISVLMLASGLASLFEGVGKRLGGCTHETCECPPGCHDEPDDDEDEGAEA